ncbi:MAG: hypothetical protein KGL39_31575 [Patescibacteria group bacterium]|nr:hypothetical protein [Patescibacteria group bacterium]
MTVNLGRARAVKLTLVAPGHYKAESQSHPGREHELSAMITEYRACSLAGCDCPCADCATGNHVACRANVKRERLWIHCSCPGAFREDEHGSSTCRHAQALGLRLLETLDEMASLPRPADKWKEASEDDVFAGL